MNKYHDYYLWLLHKQRTESAICTCGTKPSQFLLHRGDDLKPRTSDMVCPKCGRHWTLETRITNP